MSNSVDTIEPDTVRICGAKLDARKEVSILVAMAPNLTQPSRRHGTLTAEFMALHWLAGFLILDDQIEPGCVAARRAFELSVALRGIPESHSMCSPSPSWCAGRLTLERALPVMGTAMSTSSHPPLRLRLSDTK
jgi:hypothetical protein